MHSLYVLIHIPRYMPSKSHGYEDLTFARFFVSVFHFLFMSFPAKIVDTGVNVHRWK